MAGKIFQSAIFFLSLFPCIFSHGQEKKNLGAPINSKEYIEFAPTISADGRTLIYESNKNGGWKLFVSVFDENTDTWSDPHPLTAINESGTAGDFIGGPFLSYDGNTLYFTSDRPGGVGGIDIWYSERRGSQWSAPANIGAPINSIGYDGFPSVSSDGKSLYFMRSVTNRCDEFYVSHKDESGKWTEPVRLPSVINDSCQTMARIMPDNRTLIYSAIRKGGKGGFDIYKSEKLNSTEWSYPVALDFINSAKDDKFVSVPASGKIIYFTTGTHGATDIYTIEIPEGFQPKKVITVQGKVLDAVTQKPLSAFIEIISREGKQETFKIANNKEDGMYTVVLPAGKNYDFSVYVKGYSFYSDQFKLADLKEYKEYKKSISLQPIKKDASFVVRNITFASNSWELTNESILELNRIVRVMKDNPDIRVEISAHTDDLGSEASNLALSEKRAGSVVEYLVQKNIPRQQLIPKGWGESYPLVPNTTEENRAQNRRVEFKVL